MKSLSIKVKLIGGFGLLLVFLLIIALTGITKLKQVDHNYRVDVMNEIVAEKLADQIVRHIIEARYDQAEFLVDFEERHYDEAEKILEIAMRDIEKLADITTTSESVAILKEMKQGIGLYREDFAKLGEQIKTRGLDQNSGLRGAFRKAAHNVEGLKFTRDDWMIIYLHFRRAEKDYIIRGSQKYVDKNLKLVGELRTSVEGSNLTNEEKSKIFTELDTYQKGFLALVEADQSISSLRDSLDNRAELILKQGSNVLKLEEDATRQHVKDIASTTGGAIQLMIVISVISVLLAVLAVFVLIRAVIPPIMRLVRDAEKISDKDLTVDVQVNSKDELGKLSAALRKMALNLMDIITEMNSNIVTVSSSSAELSSLSQRMIVNSEKSAEISTNVATTSEEMSANTSSVAAATEEMSLNANEVSSAAEQMSQNISTVASAIEEMSISLNDVSGNAETTQKITTDATAKSKEASLTMDELGEASKEIGIVTEMIKRIADQTNLLALNATIEAASAGEAGKGFAVVANEIKELANQSSQAAGGIDERIADMQQKTLVAVEGIGGVSEFIKKISEAVSAITHSVVQQKTTVQEISENVQQTKSGANSVVRSISEIARATVDISKSSGEISLGAANISSNAGEVKHAAETTVENAKIVSNSSIQLAGLSVDLKKLADSFKIMKMEQAGNAKKEAKALNFDQVEVRGNLIGLTVALMNPYPEAQAKAAELVKTTTGKSPEELAPDFWVSVKLWNQTLNILVDSSNVGQDALVALGKKIYPTLKELGALPEHLKTTLDFVKFEAEGFMDNHRGKQVIPRKFIKSEEGEVIVEAVAPGYNEYLYVGVFLGIFDLLGLKGKVIQTKTQKVPGEVSEFRITW